MKICILTQPLYTNYGGLLQAYALQTVLKNMGHEVMTEDRKTNSDVTIIDKIKRTNAIRKLFGLKKIYTAHDKELKIIAKNTDKFIKKYINTTLPVYSTEKKELSALGFDAYVVGSDQVWRPRYSPYLQNYFLDFTKGQNVKRIAYAASFGTDEWELTPKQTAECSLLLKQFDSVSVREDSGVGLCQRYFGVDAVHLLDPTMLIEKEKYADLVEKEHEPHHQGRVMTYFLDRNEIKDKITAEVCKKLGGDYFSVTPKSRYMDVGPDRIEECVYPSVTSWLRGFMDADYVVTDSFHGTVFSIIFNKPFITIANCERGISRFTSILKVFGLENRLIYSLDNFNTEIIDCEIDFNIVNTIIKSEQEKSFSFLHSILD